MTTSTTPLTQLAAWQALEAHSASIHEVHLRQLFADDATRGERLWVMGFVAGAKTDDQFETRRRLQQTVGQRLWANGDHCFDFRR